MSPCDKDDKENQNKVRGAESDEGGCFTKVREGRSEGMVFKQRTEEVRERFGGIAFRAKEMVR